MVSRISEWDSDAKDDMKCKVSRGSEKGDGQVMVCQHRGDWACSLSLNPVHFLIQMALDFFYLKLKFFVEELY